MSRVRKAYPVGQVTIIGNTAKLKQAFPGINWDGLQRSPASAVSKPVKSGSRTAYPGGPAIAVKAHSRARPVGMTLPKISPSPGKNFTVDMPAANPLAKPKTFTFTYVGSTVALFNAVFGDKASGATVRNEYGRPLAL